MSGDGTLIVGSKYDTDDGGFVSFRWTQRDGLVWLNFHGVAAAVSGDGTTIAGADYEVGGVFAYTTNDGYVHLDTDDLYGPTAVNYDGSVIVGSSSGVGWAWDQSHGVRSLSDLMAARGVDISNLDVSVNSVSADGTVLVGTATDKDTNQSRSWIARL